jgi:uncharacterized protein
MKLQENTYTGTYRIQSCDAGGIKINDRVYASSLILGGDFLITEWRPQRFEELTREDMNVLLSLKHDVLLLGTGSVHRFIPAEWGISIECMTTPAACRTFSLLSAEGRSVVVGLLVR